MRLMFLLAAAVMVCPAQASAYWTATKKNPDVFGRTVVVATSGGNDESLIVQCDDKDILYLAFIFSKKEFQEVDTVPAELLVQVDGGSPVHLAAERRDWNNNYASVAASGRSPELLGVLKAIRGAHSTINVGFIIGTDRESSAFETAGSTEAINVVFSGCKLSGTGS